MLVQHTLDLVLSYRPNNETCLDVKQESINLSIIYHECSSIIKVYIEPLCKIYQILENSQI